MVPKWLQNDVKTRKNTCFLVKARKPKQRKQFSSMSKTYVFLRCFYRKSLPKCFQNRSKISQDGAKIVQKWFQNGCQDTLNRKKADIGKSWTVTPTITPNVGSILGALLGAFWEFFGLHFPSKNQIIFWIGFLIDFGSILEPKFEPIWDPSRIQDGVQEKSGSKAKTVKTIRFLYVFE